MKKMHCALVFLSFFLINHGSAGAQPASGAKPVLVVFDVQPLGIEKITADVTTQLFRMELSATGMFHVIDKGAMDKTLGPGYQCFYLTCASEVGKKLGAPQAMIGTLSRLGEKYFLDVKIVDVEKTEVVYSGRMTSATVEDLEIVTKRLATAVAQGKKPEETMTLETVTAKEAEEVRRREAYNTWGIMMGALIPASNSFGGVDNLNRFDLIYLYELDRAMIEFRPGFVWGEKPEGNRATDFRIELGGSFVPLKGDFSPYVGGGAGLHFVRVSRPVQVPQFYYGSYYGPSSRDAHDNAFGINFGGGVMVFRTSNLHLIADVRYERIFSPLDGYGANGISLTFGITYRARTGSFCLF